MILDKIIEEYDLAPIDSGRIGVQRPSRGYFKDADFIHYRWLDGGMLILAYDKPDEVDDARLFVITHLDFQKGCENNGRITLAKEKTQYTGQIAMEILNRLHKVDYDFNKLRE